MERRVGAVVVGVVAGLWLALPWIVAGKRAFDAVPLVAAGRLVADAPALIYPDTGGDPSPALVDEACAGYGDERPCRTVPPFVSSPAAAVALSTLRGLDATTAVFVIRVVSATMLVAMLVLLWRYLAIDQKGVRTAVTLAVALTPAAAGTVALGQSTPLVAALVLLGASSRHHRLVGLGVAAATILKLFPAAMLALLVAGRRRLAFAWAVLGLLGAFAASCVLTGADVYGDWLRALVHHGDVLARSPWNSSLDRLLAGGGPTVAPLVIRTLALATAAVVVFPHRPAPAVVWGLAGAGLVALSPQLWAHYLLVTVVAAALMFGRSRPGAVLATGGLASVANWLMTWEQVQSDALRLGIWATAITVFVAGLAKARQPAEVRGPSPDDRCDTAFRGGAAADMLAG